jgi:replicative DNA helicase
VTATIESEFDLGPDLPRDDRAEKAVIGSVLLSRRSVDDVAAALTPGDFYLPAHVAIWSAVRHLAGESLPVDPITLPAELERRGDLDRVGGLAYLHSCAAIAPTPAEALTYARIVREKADNRRLIERGRRIVSLGYSGDGYASNLTAAQAAILDLDATTDADSGRWIGDILEQVMEDAENGGEAVPTLGWPYLDMPGLPCGRMSIIAGRPGQGKSTAGLDVARHAAIHLGLPVAFFSLEMSHAEVGARCAAAEAGIPLPHIQKGEMTAQDWERWARRMGLVLDAPLYVDDFPRADPGYIRSVARRLTREKGPLGLVVVDYLQLMEDSGAPATKSRQQTVSDFSRALTIMAKELATPPVLALAQLNRGPEQRTDKKPAMSDLRESGSLEQDASMVVLLHRPDAYEKESPRAGEVDFIVAKNRGGPIDTVTLASQLHYSRFVSMATS